MTSPLGYRKQLNYFFSDMGYIHYCVPEADPDEEDEVDQWRGQVNRIESYINRSEKRILSTVA